MSDQFVFLSVTIPGKDSSLPNPIPFSFLHMITWNGPAQGHPALISLVRLPSGSGYITLRSPLCFKVPERESESERGRERWTVRKERKERTRARREKKRGANIGSQRREERTESGREREKKLKLVGHDVGSILSLTLFLLFSSLGFSSPFTSLEAKASLFPFPLLCPSPSFPFFLFSFAILWNKNKSRVNQTSPDAGFGRERERKLVLLIIHPFPLFLHFLRS